jgi:ribonuclease-3
VTGSERVAALEGRLGLSLGDGREALAALTHKSYVNEHRGEELFDNERLEFLGDAVVDLAVSHRLMERHPTAREGELSKLRASIVNEQGLYGVATTLGLGELLLLGRGEELTGGREKPSLLADALEAVIAAVYLAGGMPRVLEFVDRFFGPAIEEAGASGADRDYKTQAQELAQGRLRASPRYRVVEEHGPDHLKTFVIEVAVNGQILGRGTGRSKKDAEQLAAREALATIAAMPAVAPPRPRPPAPVPVGEGMRVVPSFPEEEPPAADEAEPGPEGRDRG